MALQTSANTKNDRIAIMQVAGALVLRLKTHVDLACQHMEKKRCKYIMYNFRIRISSIVSCRDTASSLWIARIECIGIGTGTSPEYLGTETFANKCNGMFSFDKCMSEYIRTK